MLDYIDILEYEAPLLAKGKSSLSAAKTKQPAFIW